MVHPLQASAAKKRFSRKIGQPSSHAVVVVAPFFIIFPRLFHHSGESFASTYSVRISGAFGGKRCRSMMFFKAAPKRKNQVIVRVRHPPKSSDQAYGRCFGDNFTWRVSLLKITSFKNIRNKEGFDWRVSSCLL